MLEGGLTAEAGMMRTHLHLILIFLGIGLLMWLLPPREIERRLKKAEPEVVRPPGGAPLLCAHGGGTCAWPLLPGRKRV